jgi:hypothetical protein
MGPFALLLRHGRRSASGEMFLRRARCGARPFSAAGDGAPEALDKFSIHLEKLRPRPWADHFVAGNWRGIFEKLFPTVTVGRSGHGGEPPAMQRSRPAA